MTTPDPTPEPLAHAQQLALALCAPCGQCGHEVEDHAPEGCLVGGCRCEADMTGVEVESVLASSWLAQRDARIRAEAQRELLDEIAARVEAALAEVKGADFGTVLVAVQNAYSDACRDATRRIEAGGQP